MYQVVPNRYLLNILEVRMYYEYFYKKMFIIEINEAYKKTGEAYNSLTCWDLIVNFYINLLR